MGPGLGFLWRAVPFARPASERTWELRGPGAHIGKPRNWENSSTETCANLVRLQNFCAGGGNAKKHAFPIVGFSGEDAGHTPVTSGVLCSGYSWARLRA